MKSLFALFLFTIVLNPGSALACACGCGVFDVGTSTMVPNSAGNMAWFEFNFMDQNQSRHGASAVPSDDHGHEGLRTVTTALGFQKMFDREFGIQLDVPVVSRHLEGHDDGTTAANTAEASSVGDIRLRGIYSGFSPDMSTGLTFGLKLPTGKTNAPGFDADTQIGTGSTDLLVGLYHFSALSEDRLWNAFVQTSLNLPVLTRNAYIPGHELAASYGVYYSGVPSTPAFRITPMAQLRTTLKAADQGANGHPDDTGYQRLLVAPAVEFAFSGFRIYTDAAFPIYQHFNGNQLAANLMLKSLIAYSF